MKRRTSGGDPRSRRDRPVLAGRLTAILTVLVTAAVSDLAAAVFTVGDDEPRADFRTIQPALDAALASGGFREVRIARGVYPERVVIDTDHLGLLWITGGWNARFADRSLDPAATVVVNREERGGRVLTVRCNGGHLYLGGLTLTGGSTAPGGDELWPGAGAGAAIDARGGCRAVIERNRILGNATAGGGDVGSGSRLDPGDGGGLAALVLEGSTLELLDNTLEGNFADAEGGGLFAVVRDGSRLEAVGNRFVGNRVASSRSAHAGGGAIFIQASTAQLTDNLVQGNVAAAPRGLASGLLVRAVESTVPLRLELRRNRIFDNLSEDDGDAPRAQLVVYDASGSRSPPFPPGTIVVSDSVIAGGSHVGARVSASRAFVDLVNLTIADHPDAGLDLTLRPPTGGPFTVVGALTLSNSIAYHNRTNLRTAGEVVVDRSNLTDRDPRFVDRSRRDYRLQLGSPAIDAGTLAPSGGIGPWDIDRADRVVGASVDIGAYELQGSDDNRCQVLEDLAVEPHVPACRCFSDPTLRELRCGFFLTDLLLTLRIPLPLFPGKAFGADWRVEPWTGVEGPFELGAWVVQESGKELPLGWIQGDLQDGETSVGGLEGLAPGTASPLRTRLLYLPLGAQKPREVRLDAMLPIDGKP